MNRIHFSRYLQSVAVEISPQSHKYENEEDANHWSVWPFQCWTDRWQMRAFVISWWSLNWTGLGIYIVAMIRKLGRYQISWMFCGVSSECLNLIPAWPLPQTPYWLHGLSLLCAPWFDLVCILSLLKYISVVNRNVVVLTWFACFTGISVFQILPNLEYSIVISIGSYASVSQGIFFTAQMVSLSSLLKRKGYSSKVLLKQIRGFLYRERFFFVFGISTLHFGIFKMIISGASYSWVGELFKEHLFLKRSCCSCFFILLGSLFPPVFLFLLSFLVVSSRVDQASITAESYCHCWSCDRNWVHD